MPRSSIAVDESLADALSDEARKENKTLYALANESLESVLKVCREDGTPREVYHSWRFSRMLKDMDSVPLPGDLVEKTIKKLYQTDNEWLMKTWFEEGQRIGSYLHMFAPTVGDLSKVVQEFLQAGLLPVKRLEIREVEKNELRVRAVGVGLSEESTKCAEQLISGVVSTYSLNVTRREISEGIIELKLKSSSRES